MSGKLNPSDVVRADMQSRFTHCLFIFIPFIFFPQDLLFLSSRLSLLVVFFVLCPPRPGSQWLRNTINFLVVFGTGVQSVGFARDLSGLCAMVGLLFFILLLLSRKNRVFLIMMLLRFQFSLRVPALFHDPNWLTCLVYRYRDGVYVWRSTVPLTFSSDLGYLNVRDFSEFWLVSLRRRAMWSFERDMNALGFAFPTHGMCRHLRDFCSSLTANISWGYFLWNKWMNDYQNCLWQYPFFSFLFDDNLLLLRVQLLSLQSILYVQCSFWNLGHHCL